MSRELVCFRRLTLLISLSLCLLGSSLSAQTPMATAAIAKWRPVSLPFRPMAIASLRDTFWVCGIDEMIAKSRDGGETWEIKHQKAGGEVILNIAFIQDNLGYAAGTGGLLLWTKDGGETWRESRSASDTILEISFSDDKNGLRSTGSGVEITHDGGATWASISAYKSNKELQDFKTVASLVALDDKHVAVLFRKGPEDSEAIVATTDSGQSWSTTSVPNSRIWSLVAHEGEYWAFGFEVIEKDKPGGGYGVALALHSKDGIKWDHGVRAPNEFSDCNAQGCLLWDGAIVSLFQDAPLFLAVPADGSLATQWALAKGAVCSVGSDLECTQAQTVQAPPPRPLSNRPSTGSSDPLLRGSSGSLHTCLSCPLAPFPLNKSLLAQVPVTIVGPNGQQRQIYMAGLRASLHANFVVRKDGTTDEIEIHNAPNKEILFILMGHIQDWVFAPPRKDGVPVEAAQKATIEVSCMAFPTNDQATCTLSLK